MRINMPLVVILMLAPGMAQAEIVFVVSLGAAIVDPLVDLFIFFLSRRGGGGVQAKKALFLK